MKLIVNEGINLTSVFNKILEFLLFTLNNLMDLMRRDDLQIGF